MLSTVTTIFLKLSIHTVNKCATQFGFSPHTTHKSDLAFNTTMSIFSFKKMVSTLTIRIHIKKVCLGNHGTITLFVVSLNFCGYNINNEYYFFCWSWDLSHRDYLYRDEKPVATCVQLSDQYLSFLINRHQAVFSCSNSFY